MTGARANPGGPGGPATCETLTHDHHTTYAFQGDLPCREGGEGRQNQEEEGVLHQAEEVDRHREVEEDLSRQ